MKTSLIKDARIKRAIWIMWIGIILIVAIGALVAVYFIFVKEAGAPTIEKTNMKSAVNRNTNQAEDLIITVREVLARPEAYDGRELCLDGYYQASFEFSAMAEESYTDEMGWSQLQYDSDFSDLIWINVDTPRYDCPEYQDRNKACVQKMTLCGVFKMKREDGGVGFGHLGAFQYVLEPVGGVDTNINQGVTNTTTTNTNSMGIKNCNDIVTRRECVERTDCLAVDLCTCTTKYSWYEKCGVDQENSCVCVKGGFLLCADLNCSGELNIRRLECGWKPLEGQSCDEKAISGYYFDNTQNKCEKAYLRGPECSGAPFYSQEDCHNICE